MSEKALDCKDETSTINHLYNDLRNSSRQSIQSNSGKNTSVFISKIMQEECEDSQIESVSLNKSIPEDNESSLFSNFPESGNVTDAD